MDKVNKGEEARRLAEELKKFKYMLNYSYVQAGRILREIKESKLYKLLDFNTFTAFLADPDYGMPRSTAYLYMYIYGFFIMEKGLDENDLMDIEVTRLREIIPIVDAGGDLDVWLGKARVLGKGDFFNEVNDAKGLKELQVQVARPDEDEEVLAQTPYIRLVKTSPCCVCGNRPVDAHHFPTTKGSGNTDDKTIPLCRGCHTAFHQNPKDFFWTYKQKIMDWFYDLITVLCEEVRHQKGH